MAAGESEIDRTFRQFSGETWNAIQNARTALTAYESRYATSYRRLVALNAWRHSVLEQLVPDASLAFFIEAQNDAILSHVQARVGCWRLALKSLRSLIENSIAFLYYMDHPVELSRWDTGEYRIGAAKLFEYLENHPTLAGVPPEATGLEILKREYGVLSRAVHASSEGFRMTVDAPVPSIADPEMGKLGMWLTRERHAIIGVVTLLVALFHVHISGAAQPGLRVAVGQALPGLLRNTLQSTWGVVLRV